MSEMCKPYEAPKLEYIQVMKNDMAPWEIGQVFPIRQRESSTVDYYFIYDGEETSSRMYRADCCKLIRKNVYDLLSTRIPLSVFHDTPPSDESRPEIVRVHKEAMEMYATPWVKYVTEKATFMKLTFTTTIDRETHIEHPPKTIEALIAITRDHPDDGNAVEEHNGNYIAAYGYYEDEPNKCNADITGDEHPNYYMSLEVAMQETKDQILSYWFAINATRKEQF